jgi:hypothetical protein
MKKTVIAFLVLIVVMLVAYKYMYHDHRDISNEKPLFSITVNELLKDFLADENKANKKYLDKSITIKGKITNIDLSNKTLVLDEKVFVILTVSKNVSINNEVSIQGRLIGYDSLLEEIKIDQAQIK